MTTHGQKQPTAESPPDKKLRKNARPNKSTIVLPDGGLGPLRAKIGDPFAPMDLRQLIDQARQENPTDVDGAFRKIVAKKTAEQIATLLSRLGLESTDPGATSSAFAMLAIALCGVGQVVWTPAPRQSVSWTADQESALFWLVKSLCEDEGLSERTAVRKIAEAPFFHRIFPYRPKKLRRDAKLSDNERKFQSLRQAWERVKVQKKQLIAGGRPQLIDAIVGSKPGHWETKLLGLDIADATRRSGKYPAR